MSDVTITLTIPYWFLVIMIAWIPIGLAVVANWHIKHRVTWTSSWRNDPYQLLGGILLWPFVVIGLIADRS